MDQVTRKCKICGSVKPLESKFFKEYAGLYFQWTCRDCRNGQIRIARKNNPERARAISRAYMKRHVPALKAETMAHYGGACRCCGETNLIFLTIDHVANDGNRHRKELKNHANGQYLYTWLRRRNYPPGFQVLCFNCNMAKHLNKGVCPHQQSIQSLLGASNISPTPLFASVVYPPVSDWRDGREGSRGRLVQFRGEWKTISQWRVDLGFDVKTVTTRLARGWSIERTFSTPVFGSFNIRAANVATLDGETKTLGEWARLANLRWATFDYRLRNGWSLREAISVSSEVSLKEKIRMSRERKAEASAPPD